MVQCYSSTSLVIDELLTVCHCLLFYTGPVGEYLELLRSKQDAKVISVSYRMVRPDCPDFTTVYKGLEQGLVIKLSAIHVGFNRAAMVYLNSFVQGLFQR